MSSMGISLSGQAGQYPVMKTLCPGKAGPMGASETQAYLENFGVTSAGIRVSRDMSNNGSTVKARLAAIEAGIASDGARRDNEGSDWGSDEDERPVQSVTTAPTARIRDLSEVDRKSAHSLAALPFDYKASKGIPSNYEYEEDLSHVRDQLKNRSGHVEQPPKAKAKLDAIKASTAAANPALLDGEGSDWGSDEDERPVLPVTTAASSAAASLSNGSGLPGVMAMLAARRRAAEESGETSATVVTSTAAAGGRPLQGIMDILDTRRREAAERSGETPATVAATTAPTGGRPLEGFMNILEARKREAEKSGE